MACRAFCRAVSDKLIVMGNFANEQELIVQNNLPSRRWKTRRIHTARDKEILRLNKEYRCVESQIRDLGYKDLNPPIQRGYKRLFVLTEETKYSKRADFYQGILNKINTVWYSPHKTFKQKKRRIGKWKFRIRNEQTLQEIDRYVFDKVKNFTEEERKYFYPVEYYDYPRKQYSTKYIFIEQWRFVLQTKPHMITKVQIKDSELEQYRDELGDYLDKHKNRGRLIKLQGGNTYSWKKVINEREDRKKYSYNSLRNAPLHLITEEYFYEEKELWQYEQKN